MFFVGDVHGNAAIYRELISGKHESIQLGDIGIYGIPNHDSNFHDVFNSVSGNNRFIHGNHDNPDACEEFDQFLGRYGTDGEMFWVSGAYSIDKDTRLIGYDWWENEEIKYADWPAVFELYDQVKPKVVVSHDCPFAVIEQMFAGQSMNKSITNSALDYMLNLHQPELWVFGHHHSGGEFEVGKTHFVNVAANTGIEI